MRSFLFISFLRQRSVKSARAAHFGAEPLCARMVPGSQSEKILTARCAGSAVGPSTQWLAFSLAISVLIASSVTASSLTPDFRVHRARLGAFARARLPNISDINRKAALTRWRRYREGQAATKASESRTSFH